MLGVRRQVPDANEEEEAQAAQTDWFRDTGRWEGRMTKEAFFSSMFELADIWTENIGEEEVGLGCFADRSMRFSSTFPSATARAMRDLQPVGESMSACRAATSRSSLQLGRIRSRRRTGYRVSRSL